MPQEVTSEAKVGAPDKAISMTDKLEQYLGTSLVFDSVRRVGPTTLHVNVWSYDPEAQDGFTIDCKLGVTP